MNLKKVFFIFVFGILFCGCDVQHHLVQVTQQESLFGTDIQLNICTTPDNRNIVEAAFQKAWKRLHKIDTQMNGYYQGSDIDRVNQSFEASVVVRPDTYFLLQNVYRLWEKTDGTFDITGETGGLQHLDLLNFNRVRRNHPQMILDLSLIIKGYAIDEVTRIFREHKLRQFWIDVGGSIYGAGENCEGDPWIFEVTDMNAKRTQLVVRDKAMVTADDTIRATVIADSALMAEAYSTALTILDKERGIALIDGEEGLECIIFMQHSSGGGQRFSSKKFEKYELN